MTPYLTPPELAARWRCKPETVLSLIRSGRLRGFTLSPPGSKRPRWRIAPDAITEYESRHEARPVVRVARRRKQPVGAIEWY